MLYNKSIKFKKKLIKSYLIDNFLLLRNKRKSLFIIGSQVVSTAMSFLSIIIASRFLETSVFALYTLLLLYIDYLAIISEYTVVKPIQLVLYQRYTTTSPESGRNYIYTCLMIYTIAFSIIYALSIAISSVFYPGFELNNILSTYHIYLFILCFSRSCIPILRRSSQALNMEMWAFICDLLILTGSIISMLILLQRDSLSHFNSLLTCFFFPYVVSLPIYLIIVRPKLLNIKSSLWLLKEHGSYMLSLGFRAIIQICTYIILPLIVVKLSSPETYAMIRLAQTVASPTGFVLLLFEPTLIYRLLHQNKLGIQKSLIGLSLKLIRKDIWFPLAASSLLLIGIFSGFIEKLIPALNGKDYIIIVVILVINQLIGFISTYLRIAADTFKMSMKASQEYFLSSGATIGSYILILNSYSSIGYVSSLLVGQFVGLTFLVLLSSRSLPRITEGA